MSEDDEPSAASLREMPELSPDAKLRPNPYAARIAKEGYTIHVTRGRGRPERGTETGPTVAKSIRLPPALWAKLQAYAEAHGENLHALMRKAIVGLLKAS